MGSNQQDIVQMAVLIDSHLFLHYNINSCTIYFVPAKQTGQSKSTMRIYKLIMVMTKKNILFFKMSSFSAAGASPRPTRSAAI